MTRSLLAISIGPVQDFISAARRTRDLWFGSHVLSEISKAAALALGADRLIFPNPKAVIQPESRVANVILAHLPAGVDPATAAEAARFQAQKCWLAFAKQAFDIAEKYIDRRRAEEQVQDVVEFYWASVPLPSEEAYGDARRRVMRLLAGRKMCRDFTKWDGERLPKSSLDGARETVFRKIDDAEAKRRNEELRLTSKEQLDAVGLIKRLAAGRKQYPSVSRIAADPWLRGAAVCAGELLGKVRAECLKLRKVTQIDGTRYPQYRDFPFEGTAVYRNRYKDLWGDAEKQPPEFDPLASAVKTLADACGGPPDPYLAILRADGDRMGKVISGISRWEEHRSISGKLGEFAGEAARIVADHFGCLVYSGGDDVLAFVPADLCLQCARQLHDAFDRLLKPHATTDAAPSLSVGIAIGHSMEPLEDLLYYAREAEEAAKGKERDGLAVHLHTRGGAPIRIRDQWSNGPDAELESLIRMHNAGQIPDKAGYDLRELGMLYEGWPESDTGAIPLDVIRLLKRKRVKDPETSWRILVDGMKDAKSVKLASEKIIVARKLASITRQAAPRTAPDNKKVPA